LSRLQQIPQLASEGGSRARAITNSESELQDAQSELRSRLSPIFDLPEAGRIVNINGFEVSSVDDSINQVERLLGEGNIVRIALDNPYGVAYLHPK
jgi:hypothetical protein